MFKVDYVELTRELAQGKVTKFECALRDAMCEAAGRELPLEALHTQSQIIAGKVMTELKNLDYGNKPVSFLEDFLEGFFPNFISSFRESFNKAANNA